MKYNISSSVSEKIKFKENEFSILNLKTNINECLSKYEGKPHSLEYTKIVVEEVSNIVNKTITNHIQNGDINSRFEKDFREFLSNIIDLNIIF